MIKYISQITRQAPAHKRAFYKPTFSQQTDGRTTRGPTNAAKAKQSARCRWSAFAGRFFRFGSLILLPILLTGCLNLKPDNNNIASVPVSHKTLPSPPLAQQILKKYLNRDAVARYEVKPVDFNASFRCAKGDTHANDLTAATAVKNKKPEPDNNSIWPRIRAGFQLTDNTNHPDLKREIKWFSRHNAYLNRVMKRADPFLYYITVEAEKRGLPTELVLLPIVESAYQPFAYSQGRAAGIWQFIPSTGRLYGLKQNWWYDGRRDIHASTQAALNYLNNLNKTFKGDWLLALAAYNSGSGTVKRAIRHNKHLHRPTDFWHLNLPKETRAYVPKLLALKAIIEHPKKYGISLRHVANAPGFVQVKTHSQIDLALAAKLARIKLNALYRYNPAFNRWATDPDGPYTFILPANAAATFKHNYAKLPRSQYLKWIRHKIKSGETLSEIAVKYDTLVRHLRKVNHIHGKYIRAGKYILIPVASRNRSAYTLSSSQRLKALQTKTHYNTRRIKHDIKHGESFWTIARKFKVNMYTLAKWNGMSIHDPLKPGKTLIIWRSHHRIHVARRTSIKKSSHHIQTISYTVKSGDSLSRIASRYNVKMKQLHRWNRLKKKYLQPGQRLKLYIDVTEQSGEES